MDVHDTEVEETRPDLLIVTADGQRLKCFSDILVRNSEQLKVAITMARRQCEEQKQAESDAERAAKRAKTDPEVNQSFRSKLSFSFCHQILTYS
jgi:hypothetical protein